MKYFFLFKKRPFFSPGLREEKTLKEMEKIVKNENFRSSM